MGARSTLPRCSSPAREGAQHDDLELAGPDATGDARPGDRLLGLQQPSQGTHVRQDASALRHPPCSPTARREERDPRPHSSRWVFHGRTRAPLVDQWEHRKRCRDSEQWCGWQRPGTGGHVRRTCAGALPHSPQRSNMGNAPRAVRLTPTDRVSRAAARTSPPRRRHRTCSPPRRLRRPVRRDGSRPERRRGTPAPIGDEGRDAASPSCHSHPPTHLQHLAAHVERGAVRQRVRPRIHSPPLHSGRGVRGR